MKGARYGIRSDTRGAPLKKIRKSPIDLDIEADRDAFAAVVPGMTFPDPKSLMDDKSLTESAQSSWQDFIAQEIKYFLPDAEVVSVELIGSSALSREDQEEHDLEKYGYVRDPEDRDIDVEVHVRGASQDDVERWAFSEEAEDLEATHNYDVQLRLVESTQNSWQLLAGIKE